MDATLTPQRLDRHDDTRTPMQHPRLAELVVHLTGCRPQLAVAAVNRASADRTVTSDDDRLAVVAEAMIALRRIDLREKRPR